MTIGLSSSPASRVAVPEAVQTKSAAFTASYRLEVGPIGATVQAELQRGGYSLLVVGNHQEGFSHISAEDYQLMHEVRDVPVLAL